MADGDDEDTPMRTEEEQDSTASSDSEPDEVQIEWLAKGREKRSTAGNRLKSLIQAEEPDDELELLFASDEDDAGFEDEEADQSDVQMDSSDDDEDKGPAAGADDLEGEQELQRQSKAEKLAKKRKGNDGIPKIFKKRVKIDPTGSEALPRPKKKSERASWLPTPEDAPTRASARGTTQKSKEQLHEQMVDRERKRLKQLANMEKAAARKEALKKPAMTQEDRLREAARVEKSNSKSLSRWEEAEQIREEEQRQKLAALSNRHLEGPVITWWSGLGEYVGGRLKQVGKLLTLDDPKEKVTTSKKRKAAEMEAGSEAVASLLPLPTSQPSSTQVKNDAPASGAAAASKTPGGDNPTSDKPPPPSTTTDAASISTATPTKVPTPPPVHVENEKAASTTPSISSPAPPSDQPPDPVAPPPSHVASYLPAPPPVPLPSFQLAPPNGPSPRPLLAPPPFSTPSMVDGSHHLTGFHPPLVPGSHHNPVIPHAPYLPSALPKQIPFTHPPTPTPAPPPPPPAPPVIEKTVRNYLILSNFDETAIKDKNVQTQILFNKKFTKMQKPASTPCVITSYPAKFRDPSTGLAYCNAYAYKEIQKLKRGEYRWSEFLGAYVGQGTYAARGVPSRFLGEVSKAAGEQNQESQSQSQGQSQSLKTTETTK